MPVSVVLGPGGRDNSSRMQRNLRVSFLLMTLNYWLTIRLALIGNALVCSTALYAAFQVHMYGEANAGLVGLALTYAGSLVWGLQGFLQAFVELETSLVAMERCVLVVTTLIITAILQTLHTRPLQLRLKFYAT